MHQHRGMIFTCAVATGKSISGFCRFLPITARPISCCILAPARPSHTLFKEAHEAFQRCIFSCLLMLASKCGYSQLMLSQGSSWESTRCTFRMLQKDTEMHQLRAKFLSARAYEKPSWRYARQCPSRLVQVQTPLTILRRNCIHLGLAAELRLYCPTRHMMSSQRQIQSPPSASLSAELRTNAALEQNHASGVLRSPSFSLLCPSF